MPGASTWPPSRESARSGPSGSPAVARMRQGAAEKRLLLVVQNRGTNVTGLALPKGGRSTRASPGLEIDGCYVFFFALSREAGRAEKPLRRSSAWWSSGKSPKYHHRTTNEATLARPHGSLRRAAHYRGNSGPVVCVLGDVLVREVSPEDRDIVLSGVQVHVDLARGGGRGAVCQERSSGRGAHSALTSTHSS